MGGGIESRCVGRVYGADGARNNAFPTRIIWRLYDTMMHKKPNSKKTQKEKMDYPYLSHTTHEKKKIFSNTQIYA